MTLECSRIVAVDRVKTTQNEQIPKMDSALSYGWD
jgi:hypothetical protein